MQSSPDHDPFGTTNILFLPPLDDEHPSWSGFQFQPKLENSHFYIADSESKALPSLQLESFRLALDDVSLESLDSSSTSAYDTADDDGGRKDEDDLVQQSEDFEDVWILPAVKDAPRANKLTSWDHFLNEDHREPPSRYLAEAETCVFDAALAVEAIRGPPKIIPGDVYLEAMFELALGRSSRYMRWDTQHSEFVATADDLTVSGYSSETVGEFQDAVAAMGRHVRLLSRSQSFDQHARIPGLPAFDAAMTTIIVAVNQYMGLRRSATKTLLQLQELVQGPKQLLTVVDEIHQIVRQSDDHQGLMKTLCGTAATLSITYPRCIGVLNYMLSATSRPVLSRLARDIGLQVGSTKHNATDADEPSPYAGLCSEDLAQSVSEVRETLQLLHESSIVASEAIAPRKTSSIDLTLGFTWEDLMASQAAAQDYERLARPTKPAESEQITHEAPFEIDAQALTQQSISADPMVFQPLDFANLSSSIGPANTASYQLVSEGFSPIESGGSSLSIPYDHVFALSLTPIVNAQHRLLSYSALKLLYEQCNLRSYLNLLWQFHLLGNGLFAARVSRALFDSDESSGEGRRRDGNTTGLRLQNRDAWPPASSEIRLVLMGILSEHVPKSSGGELEESISFSLRDLPEADLERCRDVDSIYALDFLRLHFKPPNSMLEAVISTDSLNKYDRIFRHLLRVLRLKSVAQALIREATCRNAAPLPADEPRFRIEIQHFVTNLADYSHNIAINQICDAFDKTQAEIERKVQTGDYEGTLMLGRCLAHLKQLHEDALDDMLRALLLKEKQARARAAVEELFDIVLRYAAAVRNRDPVDGDDVRETTIRLHDDFRRGLGELKSALRVNAGLGEQLALRLDMKG